MWIPRFIMDLFRISNHKYDMRSKDPKDYTKSDLSTEWKSDNTYCSKCMKSTGHNEYMSDICNNCGSFNTQIRFGRSYSNAKFLAFNLDFENIPEEVGAGDTDENDFWNISETYKNYVIGRGNTPNEAYYDLYLKLFKD